MAAALARTATAAAHELAEQIIEDVGHRGREVGTEAARSAAARTTHAALESRMSELIVGSPLLLIFQRFVGFVDFFEFVLGVLVAGIAVGMVFLGEPTVGRLQILFGSVPLNAENFIIVALGHVCMRCSQSGWPRGGQDTKVDQVVCGL